MNTTVTYTYKRKDGGTTTCYGKIAEDSNFEIICDNEYNDGVWTDNPGLRTWPAVCQYLEKNYDRRIEEITTC